MYAVTLKVDTACTYAKKMNSNLETVLEKFSEWRFKQLLNEHP